MENIRVGSKIVVTNTSGSIIAISDVIRETKLHWVVNVFNSERKFRKSNLYEAGAVSFYFSSSIHLYSENDKRVFELQKIKSKVNNFDWSRLSDNDLSLVCEILSKD